MKKYYQLVQDQEKREADVTIFGDITSWEWLESDVSSYTLSKELSGLDVDIINVHINSYGGEVAEGLAIYNTLRQHKAKVKTICDGFACSMASVVFMAGDERAMNSASLLMIHNAWTSASGNADDLRKVAAELEIISKTVATAYREYTTISDEELDRLLDEETWITPSDALKMGFATSIAGEASEKVPNQSARKLVFDRLTNPISALEPEQKLPAEKTVSTFFEALCAKGV